MKPTKKVIISEKIATALEALNLSKANYRHAVAIIEHLFNKASYESSDGWLYLNKTYLTAAFGKKGYDMMRLLVANGIIQSVDSYYTGELGGDPYPKRYRISMNLVEFDKHSVAADASCHTPEFTQVDQAMVLENIAKLELNYKDAMKYAHALADAITVDSFDINHEIEETVVQVITDGRNANYFVNLDKAVAEATKKGMSVMRRKGESGGVHIAFPYEYVAEIRATCRWIWTRFLTKIDKRIYRAPYRNATNNRLDTDITNMKSDFLGFMTVSGGQKIMSIDLSNSQFVLLAALLQNPEVFSDERAMFFKDYEHTDDTKAFVAAANAGMFYETLAVLLGLDNGAGIESITKGSAARATAKKCAFACVFSGAESPSEKKKLLKGKFPQLVEMTDGFKRKYGNNEFAILLQRVESEIFIDNIVPKLVEKKIWQLTKHDSVLVEEQNEPLVSEVIMTVLKDYKINGVVDVTDCSIKHAA
ncbi:hypothetical protein ACFST9_14765 [Hymenobacter monticola]|uniref:Uncharacterized protein n=1 Tax=Hymenobacter monticola TaxID=1705399 RepID=A0ABY4B0Y7_9BACT|nr:hypothetical protein [Hymenobacter monticola]UOE32825.1 hypothetical protein MTP16_17020 [Hymenobacter monticola]